MSKSKTSSNAIAQQLRATVAEIETRERDKREFDWEVRKTAAAMYFGSERVHWAGRWATIFQEQFRTLREQGKDLTSIPRYDDLAKEVAAEYPAFSDEGGCERLWDFLLSPHDPLPSRDEMTREAILTVAVELGHEPGMQGTVEPAKPKPVKLPGDIVPARFAHIVDLVRNRMNVMLIGPAGCGKTFIAKLAAEHEGLDFGAINCTAGMSEAHLIGRSMPNLTNGESVFEGTEFLRLYENGGVFLMDEIDAADGNVLLALNTALANGYCNVPSRKDAPKAYRHPDFVIIATANTFGRGADRQYVGRNQLDEASLSRFRIGTVEMDYDQEVEKKLCPVDSIRKPLQRLRDKIRAAGLRRLMDTRFIEDAFKMHTQSAWSLDKILDVYFTGWTTEEMAKVGRKAA